MSIIPVSTEMLCSLLSPSVYLIYVLTLFSIGAFFGRSNTSDSFHCHSKSLSLQSISLSTTIYVSLLKNGFKPGSSLSRAKAGNCTTDCSSPDNLSLFLCCFSNPTYLTTDVYCTTHTLVGCRASPPQGWEVYSTIWLSIV